MPSSAILAARFMLTVVFPTPPFPEATAIILHAVKSFTPPITLVCATDVINFIKSCAELSFVKAISLSALPPELRVELKDEFRAKLFYRAYKVAGSWVKLARILGVNINLLKDLKSGVQSIDIETLLKLCGVARFSETEVCLNIMGMKGRTRGVRINPIMPIPLDDRMAAWLGYTISCSTKFYQRNGGYILLLKCDDEGVSNHVSSLGEELFGVRLRGKNNRFLIPTVITHILRAAGAPTKDELIRGYRIPRWIKTGNDEICKSFLYALQSGRRAVIIPSKRRLRIRFKAVEDSIEQILALLEDIKILYGRVGIEIGSNAYIERFNHPGRILYYGVLDLESQSFERALELGFSSSRKRYLASTLLR